MKLSFYGAAHEVTGSCHFLQVNGKNILIDCGMEQGHDDDTLNELPIAANLVDFVFLTHAHIDHSGRLPMLAKHGFNGKVFATDSTTDLCGIMLLDSAHIQEFEAEWLNRKGKRSGDNAVEPMYTMRDAQAVLECFVPCDYGETIEVCEGVKIRFTDIGHLLGSACIEVWLDENGVRKKLVFSGDIGNINQPLIKDPSNVEKADYVIVESTYGDRLHNAPPDYAANLADIIQRTFDRGGNVIIPSFAVGRTQEMLYFLRRIKHEGLVKGHGDFPVFVDSPLAVEATTIFNENRRDFDEEATLLVEKKINPIGFSSLSLSITSDDSKKINFDPRPKVIISASGMCDAGRIKHHLKHNLWRRECSVVFVGYQANGTTGRIILDGAKRIKLMGEEIKINAEIIRLEGVSGHADQAGLMRWLGAFSPAPRRIFVVHGEESVCESFGALVKSKLPSEVSVPFYGEGFDLVADRQITAAIPQSTVKSARKPCPGESRVFRRLLAAGNRLLEVISHNKGGTNKDLAKFADQIEALCTKWDR